MKSPRLNLSLALCLFFAGSVAAADFDGDGKPDEFTITHDAAKAAKQPNVSLANPWASSRAAKQAPKGFGLIVRLSHSSQVYLLQDSDFFRTPIWTEGKPPVEIITRQDRGYAAWKKQVPALKADAIQLETEAGIDILLYWNGERWRLFWPNEDP